MTEKNKGRKIKDAVNNTMNKKVKDQIQRGYDIANKWKQQRKDKEEQDIMKMTDMAEALKLLKQQKEE